MRYSVLLWIALTLLVTGGSSADEPSPPLVYALYGSGDVVPAEYSYHVEKRHEDQKADFHTLYFSTVNSDGDSLSLQIHHFLKVKYFLLKEKRWWAGAKYIKKKLAWDRVIFLPIVLSDGTSCVQVFKVPENRRYYLQILEVVGVKGYSKGRPISRDYIFDPDDDYREGGLLAVATSLDNLNDAKKVAFVKKALDDYRKRQAGD